MLATLTLHGITPGVRLMADNPDIVYSTFLSLILANLLIIPTAIITVRGFGKLIKFPTAILLSIIVICSLLGGYLPRSNMFDVWMALLIGVIAFLMRFADFPVRLYPVGRLDYDSEGLLLMTDDGAFINMLTHPSGGVGKLYRVTVNPRATEQQIIEMSSGVVLDDGVKTKPCVIHVVVDEPGRSVLEITLHEGRNRQIRRMCSAVGLQVVRLRRSAEGPVKLGMLQPGEYRELKKSEINALRNAAMKSAGKGESRAASPARRPGPLKKRTNSD